MSKSSKTKFNNIDIITDQALDNVESAMKGNLTPRNIVDSAKATAVGVVAAMAAINRTL